MIDVVPIPILHYRIQRNFNLLHELLNQVDVSLNMCSPMVSQVTIQGTPNLKVIDDDKVICISIEMNRFVATIIDRYRC